MVGTKVKKPSANFLKKRAIVDVVGRIPYGFVSTYGCVASLSGFPRSARYVGWVLGGLSQDSQLPWHRVVNSKGKISPRADGGSHRFQQELLEAEGVKFLNGRIDLSIFCWKDNLEEIE